MLMVKIFSSLTLKLSFVQIVLQFIFAFFRDSNDEVLSGPATVEGSTDSDDELSSPVGRELKGETAIYYQSLIDQRDCPYIVSALLKLVEMRSSKIIIKLPFFILQELNIQNFMLDHIVHVASYQPFL